VRWSEQAVTAAQQRMAGKPAAPKPSKYRAVKVQWQGQTFDSKHELRRWQDFEQQRALGAIRAVVRQVSMPLPGTRRRIRVDFMVVELDGRIRWFDAKGFESQISLLKRDQVREGYGIIVELC
jgi:Protein of unknown function (DUF1064)